MPDLAFVRQLISDGKMREAMGLLKDLSRGSAYYDEILLQYTQNTELENQLRDTLISVEDARKSRANIRKTLLMIIEELEKRQNDDQNPSNTPGSH